MTQTIAEQKKDIDILGFQGDIGFLKVDKYISEAFEGIYGEKISDIISDDTKKITHTLTGDDVLASGIHPEKGMVLAQGESHNHYHAFRDTDALEVYAVNDNVRLLVIKKAEPIVHEEHAPVMFQPCGDDLTIYIQGGQFEYNFSEEEEEYQRVAD